MDAVGRGSISMEDFSFIMKSIRSHMLTPEMSENLEKVRYKVPFQLIFQGNNLLLSGRNIVWH